MIKDQIVQRTIERKIHWATDAQGYKQQDQNYNTQVLGSIDYEL
jgi:hypothetical protein